MLVVAEKRITFAGQTPAPIGQVSGPSNPVKSDAHTIFLLSPANILGARAKTLFKPDAKFNLALRLRNSGASLGEVFSFISGLYFRGKLAYAERFGNPPSGVGGIHIITAAAGLLSPKEIVTLRSEERV